MAVTIYSLEENKRLSKNFTVRELACPCSQCAPQVPVDDQLVAYLQQIRDHFGLPVNVSSAYRCPAYNAAVGGSPRSLHMEGMAADIWIERYLHEPRRLARYAEEIGVPGIGLYEGSRGQWFVHIDSRKGPKVYWESHEERVVPTFREPEVSVSLRVLKSGDRGEDVRALQGLLTVRGQPCDADGSFGPATAAALLAYQDDRGLETDGFCGPKTWEALLGR